MRRNVSSSHGTGVVSAVKGIMTGGDAIVEVTATDPEAGTCQGR